MKFQSVYNIFPS